jgi:hypothetical protein
VPGEIDGALHARDALGYVAALPEMQRDAIVLTAIEGRSHEEAASALGVSDGAVRGLLYRARTTLRSAAAALSPQGLLGLLARGSGDGSGLAEHTAELSAGGAAAGTAGMLTKGFLATAVAGLLAAGGTIAHLQSAPQAHRVKPASGPSASTASTTRPAATHMLAGAPIAVARSGGEVVHRSRGSDGSRRVAERHRSLRSLPDDGGRAGGFPSATGGDGSSGRDGGTITVSGRQGGDGRDATTLVSDGTRRQSGGGGADRGSGSGGSTESAAAVGGGPGPSGQSTTPSDGSSSDGGGASTSSGGKDGGSGTDGGEALPAGTGSDG